MMVTERPTMQDIIIFIKSLLFPEPKAIPIEVNDYDEWHFF